MRVTLPAPRCFTQPVSVCGLLAAMALAASATAAEQPNVVIVITDDQGYGDNSCHGNSVLRTPNIDRLHSESVRLTNFHVDPTCAPTRAALMTGKYSRRAGVWHTVMGRSFLAPEEVTLAERFGDAGYRTAIFGKWHLGDNYPLRPQDQGFDDTLVLGGGGVGQTPDFWGNDYFDDTYLRNGHPEQFEGYCTDVWFREATSWIEANRERPFLLYLATNAPHSPYNVAEKYSRPFTEAGIESPRAEFYGMIVNIDENLGRLRSRLAELGLAENTIFLFMTDNGTAAGHQKGGFNAGMRGNKGSEYDGGHRVPCFIHWPAGGLKTGRDVASLTAHIDLLPTLSALAGLPQNVDASLDGRDISAVLREPDRPSSLDDDVLVVESQRIDVPEKWRKCAVMRGNWRLINGAELYDLSADPGQKRNIAADHPELVQKMREHYELWWNRVSERNNDYVRILLGSAAAPVVHLNCHDWHPLTGQLHDVPWSQSAAVEKDPASNGFWAVEIAEAGRYAFRLRRRPASHPVPILATNASVSVGDLRTAAEIDPQSEAPQLILSLPAGPAKLQTELIGSDGQRRGAYFVEVERLP